MVEAEHTQYVTVRQIPVEAGVQTAQHDDGVAFAHVEVFTQVRQHLSQYGATVRGQLQDIVDGLNLALQ